MNRDNAKKLSDVYEPIQPSEDLVRKTEALMRAESQKICSVPRRRLPVSYLCVPPLSSTSSAPPPPISRANPDRDSPPRRRSASCG